MGLINESWDRYLKTTSAELKLDSFIDQYGKLNQAYESNVIRFQLLLKNYLHLICAKAVRLLLGGY